MVRRTRTKGQALVEFALAATLIFFMLAAVVDLGLIFFSLQALHNAAEEGATYGSRWLNGTTLDYAGIRDRARHEAGNQGIGFANLLDLNSNGKDDVTFNEQSNGKPLVEDYIQVAALLDENGDKDPLNDGTAPNYTPCPNVAGASGQCYILVVVSEDYNMAFPLAPAFGDKIKLRSSFVMTMRSGFSQGGPPPAP